MDNKIDLDKIREVEAVEREIAFLQQKRRHLMRLLTEEEVDELHDRHARRHPEPGVIINVE